MTALSSRPTRRRFQRDLGLALAGGGWILPIAYGAPATETSTGSGGSVPPACNFQSSFMTWDYPPPAYTEKHDIPYGNIARIQLDAITDVIDDTSGERVRFVLIHPCRTERVYKEDRLFQIPSAEYRVIYSLEQQRSVGKGMTYGGRKTVGKLVRDTYRSLVIDVVTFPKTRVLRTPAEVNKATGANHPLIGRTEIKDPKRPLRYVIEYPIKTMNFMPKDNSYQIDTGPLLVPDFDLDQTSAIDRMEMAHVAFNHKAPDLAEFILRQPTPVVDDDGRELCQVLHYSKVRVHAARNSLLAGIG